MTRKRNTIWGAANYAWAMSLQGHMNRAQAEDTTGIPAGTIAGWWRGRPPLHESRTHTRRRPTCGQGHPLEGANIYHNRPGHRQCRTCRNAQRRAARRRQHFHATYNPDPLLAPLERLWLPADEVVRFVLSRYTDTGVRQQLDKNGGEYRRWYECVTEQRAWLRYDSADRLFIAIGLVVSEMDCEPVYGNVSPAKGATRAAA